MAYSRSLLYRNDFRIIFSLSFASAWQCMIKRYRLGHPEPEPEGLFYHRLNHSTEAKSHYRSQRTLPLARALLTWTGFNKHPCIWTKDPYLGAPFHLLWFLFLFLPVYKNSHLGVPDPLAAMALYSPFSGPWQKFLLCATFSSWCLSLSPMPSFILFISLSPALPWTILMSRVCHSLLVLFYSSSVTSCIGSPSSTHRWLSNLRVQESCYHQQSSFAETLHLNAISPTPVWDKLHHLPSPCDALLFMNLCIYWSSTWEHSFSSHLTGRPLVCN